MLFWWRSLIILGLRHARKRYDLVHVHSIPDFMVFAAALPKLTGCRIILDIHDLVPEFYADKFGVSSRSLIFKILGLVERISCRFADHVIISNHIWQKTLHSRSVSENKCSTILNYPDPRIFHLKKTAANGKFVIMNPGSMSWH